MAITTYTNEPYGFGVTYDDARLACVDDPRDPRLPAAWSHRIHSEIAASALLTAAGAAFSVPITTDSAASGPHLLSSLDWDAVTLQETSGFLVFVGQVAEYSTAARVATSRAFLQSSRLWPRTAIQASFAPDEGLERCRRSPSRHPGRAFRAAPLLQQVRLLEDGQVW